MASLRSGARQRLMQELAGLQKEPWVNIEEDDNLFKWRIALMVVNPDSVWSGSYLKAEMTFSDQYPYKPPGFRFRIPIFHPNIYADGKLCISILHEPGEDLTSGEAASERWSPLQGAESVLRSVLLLLDDPEINSPANVDAGVMYRDNRADYDKKAKETVEKSKKDIPAGFVMPSTFEVKPASNDDDDEGFWAQSDEEDFDFGSDTPETDDDLDEEEGDECEGEDDEL